MIGRADTFLGTANYTITNKKLFHLNKIITLANGLKMLGGFFHVVKIVIELLIICYNGKTIWDVSKRMNNKPINQACHTIVSCSMFICEVSWHSVKLKTWHSKW